MRRSDDRHLVLVYICLAAGCVMLGTGITFALLAVCAYFSIDIMRNLWLLAVPLFASLIINVLLIEIYRRLTGR
jgi:hypothetical protein